MGHNKDRLIRDGEEKPSDPGFEQWDGDPDILPYGVVKRIAERIKREEESRDRRIPPPSKPSNP